VRAPAGITTGSLSQTG